MAADLTGLDPAFREHVETLLANCKARGVIMRPFFALRTPHEQARLWRQSRTAAEVVRGIDKLRAAGAPWLADALESVGPTSGKWATNALPGASWHNLGEAVDCFVVGPNGDAIWDSGHPGYETYAQEAEEIGLTAGHRWTSRDSVHVQLRPDSSVLAAMGWPAIDVAMRARFA